MGSWSPSWFPLWSLYRWKLIACGCLYLTGIIGLIVTLTVNVLPNRPHDVLVEFEYFPSRPIVTTPTLVAAPVKPFDKIRPLHGTWDPTVPYWVQLGVSLPQDPSVQRELLVYAARPFMNITSANQYIHSLTSDPNVGVYYHHIPNPDLSYTELLPPTLYTSIGDGLVIRDIFLLVVFSSCIVGAAWLNLMVVCDHWYPVYGTEQYVQKQTIIAQRERLASDADEIRRPASRQKLTRAQTQQDDDDDEQDMHDLALEDAEQLARVIATRQARSNSMSEEQQRRRQQRHDKKKLKSIKYQHHVDDDVEMQTMNHDKNSIQQEEQGDRDSSPANDTVIPALDMLSIVIDPSSLPPPPTDRQNSQRSQSLPEPPNALLDAARASVPRLSVDTSQ